MRAVDGIEEAGFSSITCVAHVRLFARRRCMACLSVSSLDPMIATETGQRSAVMSSVITERNALLKDDVAQRMNIYMCVCTEESHGLSFRRA